MMADTIMPPVHPGRDPADRVLEPLRVNQSQLANGVEMPAGRINQIVHGRRRISADRALRLALYFGTEWFWMNLQTRGQASIRGSRPTRPRLPTSRLRGGALRALHGRSGVRRGPGGGAV